MVVSRDSSLGLQWIWLLGRPSGDGLNGYLSGCFWYRHYADSLVPPMVPLELLVNDS